MKGILGRKVGMTQVFAKNGKLVPVTVIEVEENVVTQIKTVEKDGYDAIQLGAVTAKEKSLNRPKVGHTNKANTSPKRFLKELRGVDVNNYTLGQVIKADVFEEGEYVDVCGLSKGKGTQGPIKRWNFSRGPMGHGSQYHRAIGSLGTIKPARVFRGTEMAGRTGGEITTIQNLQVVAIDLENNAILVKGNVPGPKKSLVFIKTAVKKGNLKGEKLELVYYEDEKELVEDKVEEIVEETAEEVVEEAKETVEEETEEKVEETTEEKEDKTEEESAEG